jgi:hypothetical protein
MLLNDVCQYSLPLPFTSNKNKAGKPLSVAGFHLFINTKQNVTKLIRYGAEHVDQELAYPIYDSKHTKGHTANM